MTRSQGGKSRLKLRYTNFRDVMFGGDKRCLK